ncbi:conserved protein of unknown function (plasmid) [Rhodovastum atsumiense]|uniref:DUF2190 family protein n=1 Tax=Rhodovastum atsumiense TaxID=504468 RepID=A0A5M6IU74_9PROT|nr:hypothetical protein [Rhodovastum atsumiense]KAA5611870.1 hypothetical protein F1189_12620 [Rhodovastum atsumiense]CAH2606152.1 conserved protein of unknown function [Rhodovastum atsumiense]
MPAVQTAYQGQHAAAFAGLVADSGSTVVISRVVESPNGMQFGAVALQGVADNGILDVGDVNAGAFRGITVVDPLVRPVNNDAYGLGDTAAVLVKGVVWVTVAAAVTAGQPVYYSSTGALTNVAASDTAIPNAIFDSSAAAGGLAKVRLN